MVLFVQSLLFQLLVCFCCCAGRTQAQNYDRMFTAYSVLLLFSVGTYAWAFVTRYAYTSKVCSGDFLNRKDMEDDPILLWDLEHEYYLIKSGRLLNFYIAIESIFLFCCVCASKIWCMIQPRPFARFTTSVDSTTTAQYNFNVQDRMNFKEQIHETDAIIYKQK